MKDGPNDTNLARATPFFWLEGTLASYEVEEVDGHELAKFMRDLAVGIGIDEVPEAKGSGTA